MEKYIFLQRKWTKGVLVHEKIFDIINRQGDMSQNYGEMPLPLLGWLEPKR